MITIYIVIIISGIACGFGVGLSGVLLLKSRKQKKILSEDLKNTTFVFSGNLKQTNLVDAVQFLEIGRREGVLHIYSGRRKGYLIFSKGNVIDAFYRNSTGREAVLSMLEIDEGDFYFEPKTICQPRVITESIITMAFEFNERQRDENIQTTP